MATQELPRSVAHPFYTRLNQILEQHDFDGYVEGLCQRFYADDGRPGLPPGRYFRLDVDGRLSSAGLPTLTTMRERVRHDGQEGNCAWTDRRKLSLVDCSSFHAMRIRLLRSAFAFHPHFREQGFELLPSSGSGEAPKV